MSRTERKSWVKRDHSLPVTRQCNLLAVCRSTVYYQPVGMKEEDLELMGKLDALHLKYPFYGSRRFTADLRVQGYRVGRKRVRRLMRIMGIETVYPKRRTSIRERGHTVYPYLLRGVKVTRANQVWAADITYIPMAKGFLYLVMIVDWYSRKVLAWNLSNTMDVQFCLDALDEALQNHGTPEIFNTDQGAQFTSEAFTDRLKKAGVRISMDGKGRWMDNRIMERVWRSVKYEEVYLKAYETVKQAKVSLGRWVQFYNTCRPHQSLNYNTPNEVYDEEKQPVAA